MMLRTSVLYGQGIYHKVRIHVGVRSGMPHAGILKHGLGGLERKRITPEGLLLRTGRSGPSAGCLGVWGMCL